MLINYQSNACGVGWKQRFNPHRWCYCQPRVSFFSYPLAFGIDLREAFCMLTLMGHFAFYGSQGHFMGNEGQNPTSQLLWFPHPSFHYPSWVLPGRGDLCSIQEPPSNGILSWSFKFFCFTWFIRFSLTSFWLKFFICTSYCVFELCEVINLVYVCSWNVLAG